MLLDPIKKNDMIPNLLIAIQKKGNEKWLSSVMPFDTVRKMVNQIKGHSKYDYLILFAPEFIEVLLSKGVSVKNITFIADRTWEAFLIKKLYNVKTSVFSQRDSQDDTRGKKRKGISLKFKEKMEGLMPNAKKLIIFGNPPYQKNLSNEGDANAQQAVPIYNKFIDACVALGPKYLSMIIPSRWMQGGRGLDDFRQRMKSDKRIRSIRHFPGQSEIFKNVSIRGGVNYFLWDRDYNGLCEFNGTNMDLDEYDVVVLDTKAYPLLKKIPIGNCLNKRVVSTKPFGIRGFFSDWKESGVKCYAKKGQTGFVGPDDFNDKYGILNKWKVCVANAGDADAGKDGKYTNFNYTLTIPPGEICTETFVVVNYFDTEEEAKNFITYMQTKFLRFFLKIRTASILVSKDSFGFVPDLGDYSHPWNDEALCEKFGITDEEFKYIDSLIRSWDDIKSKSY